MATKAELGAYFKRMAMWRRDIAESRCREGTWGRLKNELYAERLEEVAAHVEALPDDSPVLAKAVNLDLSYAEDGMHTWTIHCEFGAKGQSPSERLRSLDKWLEVWVGDAIETADKDRKYYERVW